MIPPWVIVIFGTASAATQADQTGGLVLPPPHLNFYDRIEPLAVALAVQGDVEPDKVYTGCDTHYGRKFN